MADGIVEEIGTPNEIFDNPKSEKLKAFLSGIDNKDGE
jgi:ABC-type histidine transport system ATPase subunit